MSAEMLAANLVAHWIQAGVLALVTLSACRLLRVKDPRLSLAVLHGVLLLIVLLPWMQPWQTIEALPRVMPLTAGTAQTVDVLTGASTPAIPVRSQMPIDRATIALGVIAAGIALRLTWLAYGLVRLRRFSGETRHIAPPALTEALHEEIGAAAQYVEHPTAGSPSTFGIIRPRVVLPIGFAGLSVSRQRAALCHELIHVRRHDVAAALAEEIFTAAFWFHPWIWLIRRRIRVAREQVVDLRALALTGDRAEYVRCLIEMSGYDLVPHLSQTGAAIIRSRELRARVDAIFQEVRMSRIRLVTVSAALAAIVGAAGWIATTQVALHAMTRQTAPEQGPLPALLPLNAVEISKRAEPQLTAGTPAVAMKKMLVPVKQPSQQAGTADQPRSLMKVAYGEYPAAALDKQISGTVMVNITVNSAGEVSTADVVSGPQELRASAFKAAMGLKYSPGAGTIAMSIGVEYRLDRQSWGVRIVNPPAPSRTLDASQSTPSGALRIGGDVRAPRKIKDMPPMYPAEALRVKVQGVVILEVTVSETGNVSDVKVLRSVPLLDAAAIEAVKQWQYEPTLLNGAPVPVIMTVTVNFSVRNELSLQIGLPDGTTATLPISLSSGFGTLAVPAVGTFGFAASAGSTPSARTITIYEIGEPGTAPRLLGNVEVTLGGGVVQSPTTPSFGVELAGLP